MVQVGFRHDVRVQGLGFRVYGLGFMVQVGFRHDVRVQGLGFRV
jgi:hypothetical protein